MTGGVLMPESGASRVHSLMAMVLSMGLSMESQRYSSFQSAPFPPPPLVDFLLCKEFDMLIVHALQVVS